MTRLRRRIEERVLDCSTAFRIAFCLTACSIVLLGTHASAEVFREDFDDNHIDPALWTVQMYGSGPQLAETNQELEILFPSNSSGGDFGFILISTWFLRGDFDVQADFRLLTWPYRNGIRMAMGIYESGLYHYPGAGRISFGQSDYYEGWEVYLTDFADGVNGITQTDDMTGTIRLVRTGALQTAYYSNSGQWVPIHTGPAPSGDVPFKVSAFSAYQFTHQDVLAAWDNIVVNSGEIVGLPVPTRSTTWGGVKALYR
jgi:hypothetical protein